MTTEMAVVIAPFAAALPPADDRLFGPDAFGWGWLIAGIAMVLVAAYGLLWALRPARRARIAVAPTSIVGLRERYLRQLDELEQEVVAERISIRALHHQLSRTLRRFAAELGTERATSMSASALQQTGHVDIAAALRRFEHPQFESSPSGDPMAGIRTARGIVTDPAAVRLRDEARSA